MEQHLRYAMALGAFCQASAAWAVTARDLGEASRELDPRLPDDPQAAHIIAGVAEDFRRLAKEYPGIRELLAAALVASGADPVRS